MKNPHLSLVITLKSDHLNEIHSLCDCRYSIIMQGQENERSRCLQSYISNQETEQVRDAKDGTTSSKTSKLQLEPLDDLISSPGEREFVLPRCFYFPSISD